jgi:hypothetical protein
VRALAALLLALVLLPLPARAADAQDDCGSGGDAPYAPQEGLVLQLPVDCAGAIGPDDERDSYRFEAPPGTTFHVEVTTDQPDASHGVVFVYSPDHGQGEGPAWAGDGVDSFNLTSTEPGLWSFYLYLCNGPDCGDGQGSYRLRIWTDADAWQPRAWTGNLTFGAPLLPDANELLGPGSQPTLDAAWVDLGGVATGVEFARLGFTGCASCLTLAFTDAAGARVPGSGACGTRDGELECFVPPGAARAVVGDHGGVGVGWTLTYWAPG